MKRLDYYWNSVNVISLLLLPLAGLFYLISRLRLILYKLGLFTSFKAPVPVIIVGNITVGGTGKTPLIIKLVELLQQQGFKPGVISRGYGGKATSWPQRVNENTSAVMVGDEPQLIYLRTGCPVVVGPDRQQDIRLLLETDACDLILADDGLQHYALQRDIEIAVVDAKRLYGNGFFIPAGPLREPVSRLKQVNLLLFNGGTTEQNSFNMQLEHCLPVGKQQTARHTARHSAIALTEFAGQTVHAVAGIGHPQRFFDMLEALDIHLIKHEFADHYAYQATDLMFDDEYAVLMTEKDAVKCATFNFSNHWSVPVEIVFSATAEKSLTQIIRSI